MDYRDLIGLYLFMVIGNVCSAISSLYLITTKILRVIDDEEKRAGILNDKLCSERASIVPSHFLLVPAHSSETESFSSFSLDLLMILISVYARPFSLACRYLRTSCMSISSFIDIVSIGGETFLTTTFRGFLINTIESVSDSYLETRIKESTVRMPALYISLEDNVSSIYLSYR